MTNAKYELWDTFRGVLVSRHRTPFNAGKAARRYIAGLSDGAYLPTTIRVEGSDASQDDLDEFHMGSSNYR